MWHQKSIYESQMVQSRVDVISRNIHKAQLMSAARPGLLLRVVAHAPSCCSRSFVCLVGDPSVPSLIDMLPQSTPAGLLRAETEVCPLGCMGDPNMHDVNRHPSLSSKHQTEWGEASS